jgi:hypothetical protein
MVSSIEEFIYDSDRRRQSLIAISRTHRATAGFAAKAVNPKNLAILAPAAENLVRFFRRFAIGI